MNEFHREIRARIAAARRSLAEARLAGDDYLAEVRTGELESLTRVALDHGVRLGPTGQEDEPAEEPIRLDPPARRTPAAPPAVAVDAGPYDEPLQWAAGA